MIFSDCFGKQRISASIVYFLWQESNNCFITASDMKLSCYFMAWGILLDSGIAEMDLRHAGVRALYDAERDY